MMIKIMCLAALVLGGWYLGKIKGERGVAAARQAGELAEALKMLEFDVSFLRLPAKEAFLRISFSKENAVKKIFDYMANTLEKNDCGDMRKIFAEALEKYKCDIFICDFAKETMYNFFKSFGTLDGENEILNIKAAYTKLKFVESSEMPCAEEKAKLLKKCGFLAGMFFAIILF